MEKKIEPVFLPTNPSPSDATLFGMYQADPSHDSVPFDYDAIYRAGFRRAEKHYGLPLPVTELAQHESKYIAEIEARDAIYRINDFEAFYRANIAGDAKLERRYFPSGIQYDGDYEEAYDENDAWKIWKAATLLATPAGIPSELSPEVLTDTKNHIALIVRLVRSLQIADPINPLIEQVRSYLRRNKVLSPLRIEGET